MRVKGLIRWLEPWNNLNDLFVRLLPFPFFFWSTGGEVSCLGTSTTTEATWEREMLNKDRYGIINQSNIIKRIREQNLQVFSRTIAFPWGSLHSERGTLRLGSYPSEIISTWPFTSEEYSFHIKKNRSSLRDIRWSIYSSKKEAVKTRALYPLYGNNNDEKGLLQFKFRARTITGESIRGIGEVRIASGE